MQSKALTALCLLLCAAVACAMYDGTELDHLDPPAPPVLASEGEALVETEESDAQDIEEDAQERDSKAHSIRKMLAHGRKSVQKCRGELEVLTKEVADGDKARAKELKMVGVVSKLVGKLTRVGASRHAKAQMAQLLTQLSGGREYKEVTGPQGITVLLDKLKRRINRLSRKAHADLRAHRKKCQSLCSNTKTVAQKLVKHWRGRRKNLRFRRQQAAKRYYKRLGKYRAMVRAYRGDRKKARKDRKRAAKEIAILKVMLAKLKELDSVKTSDLEQDEVDEAESEARAEEKMKDLGDLIAKSSIGSDPAIEEIVMQLARPHGRSKAIVELVKGLIAKLRKQRSDSKAHIKRSRRKLRALKRHVLRARRRRAVLKRRFKRAGQFAKRARARVLKRAQACSSLANPAPRSKPRKHRPSPRATEMRNCLHRCEKRHRAFLKSKVSAKLKAKWPGCKHICSKKLANLKRLSSKRRKILISKSSKRLVKKVPLQVKKMSKTVQKKIVKMSIMGGKKDKKGGKGDKGGSKGRGKSSGRR